MSASDQEREKPGEGFVVIDKRGRDEAEPEPRSAAETAAGAHPEEAEAPLPKADFAGLLVSLATSALVHLGILPDPVTQKPAPKNLALARHTIEVLEMLQGKTRGNLDPEEEKLIQNLLTELRMRFVEASR